MIKQQKLKDTSYFSSYALHYAQHYAVHYDLGYNPGYALAARLAQYPEGGCKVKGNI